MKQAKPGYEVKNFLRISFPSTHFGVGEEETNSSHPKQLKSMQSLHNPKVLNE